jgi:hypothetical protein
MPINEFVEQEKWNDFGILNKMEIADEGLIIYVG